MTSLAGAACGRFVEANTAPDMPTSTSPELVREETEYGGWVLPTKQGAAGQKRGFNSRVLVA
ncbi:hypothetical protein [Nocardia goodfellowii]|uniref:DUF397 domain-containing protein n=1 Tax=Nocardia goodfellowii TaxID=882446 RepID=A0ABS4QDC0_9NOCA|nr:hypothetical protein [Nocardia goodfellowii]MBP2189691.1 hypothetical protein [Nocardia goodfellowii]